ncbi:MAG: glucose-1-phosphate cytidylyltransferase [Psychroserpens sp.]|jgi:glucose-1-phosphate cytidylyltransferase
MKVVILAGGFGTRLSEETHIRPKPMTEIGEHPIIWHIMKTYSYYGYNDFVVLLGYKGYYIKEYFANYFLHNCDVTIDVSTNSMQVHNNNSEPWKVTLVETGLHTMTGGRIKRASSFIGNEPFMLTYGDGVCDIDINKLVACHRSKAGIMTVSSVLPKGRFGVLEIDKNDNVSRFFEKPQGDGGWINAGYFVCEPEVFDYISDDPNCVFEQEPMQKLASDGKLFTYQHMGFWKCLDTLRDKHELNQLWNEKKAKWKVW